MLDQLFRKPKKLNFERTFRAPQATVWRAWTEPEMLQKWWGPEKTTVPECRLDLRVDGEIYIVMEASSDMGKYQGTRWPMEGTFTVVDAIDRLTYDARSWTEGEEDGSTIHHTNDVTFAERDGYTVVNLDIAITQIGAKAKMAAFGMKWGYKAQLDKLEQLLLTEL